MMQTRRGSNFSNEFDPKKCSQIPGFTQITPLSGNYDGLRQNIPVVHIRLNAIISSSRNEGSVPPAVLVRFKIAKLGRVHCFLLAATSVRVLSAVELTSTPGINTCSRKL